MKHLKYPKWIEHFFNAINDNIAKNYIFYNSKAGFSKTIWHVTRELNKMLKALDVKPEVINQRYWNSVKSDKVQLIHYLDNAKLYKIDIKAKLATIKIIKKALEKLPDDERLYTPFY